MINKGSLNVLSRLCYLLLLFFLVGSMAQAQNTQRFFDSFGLQGEVKSRGTWTDTLLPEKGNFELRWRELSAQYLKTFAAKGNLKNHAPNGNWLWEEGEWNYTIEPGKTLSPNFNTAGKRFLWEASFQNGKPQGLWKLNIDSVNSNMQIQKKGLQIQATFESGLIAGKFSISDVENNFSLTGFCDNDGFATGIWIYQYRKDPSEEIIKEERTYEQGLLLEIKTTTKDGIEHKNFELVKIQLAALKSAEENPGFRIGAHSFDNDGTPSTANEFKNHYFNNLFYSGFQLSSFPFSFERKGPFFKKIEYPISETETHLIAQTDSLIQLLSKEIEKRLSYRNLLINRGWSSELDLAIAFAKASLEKFQLIDSLQQRTQLPLFNYKNRFEQGVLHWVDLLNENKEAKGAFFDSLSINLPLADRDTASFEIFKIMHQLVLNIADELHTQLPIIDKSYNALHKEDELQQLEDVMSEKLALLDNIYQPLTGLGADIRQRWIAEYFRNQLQIYTQTADYETAKSLGNLLLEKMEIMIANASDWQLFDKVLWQWKEQYTQFAYNPYNGKYDIEIRLKKRFYNKAVATLHPWVIEKFYAADEWNSLVSHWNLSKELHQDMLDFAKQDDKSSARFEKRFRKEKSPERMAKMLHNFMRNR